MARTPFGFRCDLCGWTLTLPVADDATVWEIVEELIERHRAAAPACAGDAGTFRIVPAAKHQD